MLKVQLLVPSFIQYFKMGKRYQSVLGITIGFLILFLIFDAYWLLYTSASIGFISLLSSRIAKLISDIWLKFTSIIGVINSYVILGLVFILILVPLSFVFRIFNKDILSLDTGKKSYFQIRNHTYGPKDLKNPW